MRSEVVEYGISQREQEVMYNLLKRVRPEITAEIGCANGGSTQLIAQALQHNDRGHHHAVDPFQEKHWKNAGKIKVSAANLSHRVTFHDDYPEAVFPKRPALDFVFIDGSHLFDLTIIDFVMSDRRLKVGGIMGFHDTWMGAVRSVIRFILLNRSYEPQCEDVVWPPMSRLRRFRRRAGLQLARLVCGESDLIVKREPFHKFGLDRSNLVFVRKTGEDTRDWRFFNEF